MPKFLGTVSLVADKGFIALKSGGDYAAQEERDELVTDILTAAKEHKLRVAAFVPEADGGKKEGYATTWSVTQLAKLLKDGREAVVMQSRKARFPAPYLAFMIPAADDKPAAKPKAGPDLSRKAKASTGPDLSRK